MEKSQLVAEWTGQCLALPNSCIKSVGVIFTLMESIFHFIVSERISFLL